MFYKAIRAEIRNRREILSSKLVWEGTDLAILEKMFPRHYFTNGNTLDNLRPMPKGENVMEVTFFYRRETEAEPWQTLQEDPRRAIVQEPHGRRAVFTPEEIKRRRAEDGVH